jgi:hypothetical protein
VRAFVTACERGAAGQRHNEQRETSDEHKLNNGWDASDYPRRNAARSEQCRQQQDCQEPQHLLRTFLLPRRSSVESCRVDEVRKIGFLLNLA